AEAPKDPAVVTVPAPVQAVEPGSGGPQVPVSDPTSQGSGDQAAPATPGAEATGDRDASSDQANPDQDKDAVPRDDKAADKAEKEKRAKDDDASKKNKAATDQPAASAAAAAPADVDPAASLRGLAGISSKTQVPPANGSFTQRVPLDLPDFQGLEPGLALVYD